MTTNRGGGFGFPEGYFDEYGEVARPTAAPLDAATAKREQEASLAASKARAAADSAVLYDVLGGPLKGQQVRGRSPMAGLADWMLKIAGTRERAQRQWDRTPQRVVRADGSEFPTRTEVLGRDLKEVK